MAVRIGLLHEVDKSVVRSFDYRLFKRDQFLPPAIVFVLGVPLAENLYSVCASDRVKRNVSARYSANHFGFLYGSIMTTSDNGGSDREKGV